MHFLDSIGGAPDKQEKPDLTDFHFELRSSVLTYHKQYIALANQKKKKIEHFSFSLFKLKYMFAKEDPSTRKTRSCKIRNINASWPQSFSASLTSFNLEKFSRSLALSLAIIGQKLNSKALTLCLLTC